MGGIVRNGRFSLSCPGSGEVLPRDCDNHALAAASCRTTKRWATSSQRAKLLNMDSNTNFAFAIACLVWAMIFILEFAMLLREGKKDR